MQNFHAAAIADDRRDFYFMLYQERKAIATRYGQTDTFLWTINFKDGETTSNALAPLIRRLKPRLNGQPLIMLGIIVPAGRGVKQRHGHGVLFLPEDMEDTLKAATKARSANVPRSYQFQRPNPEKGGETGWLNYGMCSRNGLKIGSEFYASRIVQYPAS